MKVYFPGSFNPPTYGHLEVLRKACDIFPEIVVVCSENPNKIGVIKASRRIWLWQSYQLPTNCRVLTFSEAQQEQNSAPNAGKILIRGIRSDADLQQDQQVVKLNHEEFGFDFFFSIWTPPELSEVSSGRCRELAQKGDLNRVLCRLVSPLVERYLLDVHWYGPSLAGFRDDWE
ncbi:MAG: adenylyltransferase/cytidyltransferase family protein [Patescibacteria group bacterium]|jgi:pantetheine-phosphate adenylyltransferase